MRLRLSEVLGNKTMKELAEQLDLDPQTVMYWNQGRTYPRLPMLLTLCRVLDTTVETLVDENYSPASTRARRLAALKEVSHVH